MDKEIMGVTIITEAPDEKGYFYSSLELPATNVQIEDALHKARWLKDTKGFTDINVDSCDALQCLIGQVLESADIWELNYFVTRVQELSQEELVALDVILSKKIEAGEYKEGIPVKELINHTYRLNEVPVIFGVKSDEDVGQFVIENSLNEDVSAVPDDSVYLLDKEKIGKFQRETDGGVFKDGYYIATSTYHLEEVFKPKELKKECQEQDIMTMLRSMLGSLKTNEMTEFVQYVKWYMQLSEMDQIKFKAIAEAEPFQDFSEMRNAREHFEEYEFMYYCDDAQSFFKEHLLHNLDARYDSEWLKTLLCETEGRELLEQLGATLTSYGVVSACGVPLYSLVPCKQETEAVQDESDEIEEMGGISQ